MSEFTIRASGADKASLRHLVARFPLAFRPNPSRDEVANAPELKQEGDSWLMGQMEAEETKSGARGMPGQWVLEEQSGRPRFVGQPEGGLRDSGAGYFLLMKGKGSEFIAAPVTDMFTFKPALQRRHQTLEDAEAAMQAQRLQHEKANPRLAKAIVRDEDDPLAILKEEDQADSDEEWKAIKERAAAKQLVNAAPLRQQQQARQQRKAAAVEGGQDRRPEGDDADADDKGEDWEHEDEAADDDLDMGEEEEEADAPSPIRRGLSSDSEGEGGALQPERAKRRLKRMMRETGLEDSEDEGSDEGEGEEESESIQDEEDLDRMAGAGGAVAAAREPTPEAPLRAAQREEGSAGKKRKSPMPQQEPSQAPAAAAAASPEQAAKRARTAAAGPAGAVAAGTAAAAGAAAAQGVLQAAARPAAAAGGGGGKVTAEELRQVFRSKGRILLSDLTAMYKPRLGPGEFKDFVALVKLVARMEPGTKYLVLKD